MHVSITQGNKKCETILRNVLRRKNILKISQRSRVSSSPVPSSRNPIVSHRLWFSRFTRNFFSLGIYNAIPCNVLQYSAMQYNTLANQDVPAIGWPLLYCNLSGVKCKSKRFSVMHGTLRTLRPKQFTVEPFYNKVLDLENAILQPGQHYNKMYGRNPSRTV